jgi:steroid 5-alpha reductase family enzyme
MVFENLHFIVGIIGLFVSMLFVLSVIIKRNDIADIAWWIGIFIVAFASYLVAEEKSVLLVIMLVLAALWGGRLSLRILLRNIRKSEDYRYKKWRDEWGRLFYPRSYVQVYLLQGALMIVVGYSFVHAGVYGGGASLGILQFVGLGIWVIGYFFEVVGDWQLDKFIKNKPDPGTILSAGLWKYTRHPNYFGEVTMWWGIWLMVATLPFGYIALVSPLMITFLILKVSGIPMLEKAFADNPVFQEYKKRTNAFFPFLPKNIK